MSNANDVNDVNDADDDKNKIYNELRYYNAVRLNKSII